MISHLPTQTQPTGVLSFAAPLHPTTSQIPLAVILANLCAGQVVVIRQIRWGLRNRRTGAWYSPIDHVRMRPYPLSFGCRAEASATLDVIGNLPAWEALPFPDSDYDAAIVAAGELL